MAERQHAIEAAVERPVESLRSLTRGEALRVLTLLSSTPAPHTVQTSAWDDREDDTWIDRL
jgi:DNA polymerase-3 subunit epsilon